MTSRKRPAGAVRGTRVAGVGTSVGVNRPSHGGHWAGTGRAAELASEAARIEGASSPATDRATGGR
jgi:hypothetical protein